ncbi:hypothetical protein BKA93DRAFT_779846 [Sparassis latifolia]|uniref:F-box domain-containing protein n=1 Tax=Sparassis crispa TaxID=139825 RepID=A0A401GF83_9APHY|nr:hypothetical protein SCP_0305660 [Sparassis crispa]GBE80846.1 hypothetical protein SCP_0305660 [Sparassis crispa]
MLYTTSGLVSMVAASRDDMPTDVLPLIFEHADRRDLHICASLSRSFHRAATPILYRRLDSRIDTRSQQSVVLHPSTTLLEKRDYARYVRHVRETSGVAFYTPGLLPGCREALNLCTNLVSFSWSDDSAGVKYDKVLLDYLDVLKGLNVQELTIHTYLGFSEEVWSKLKEFTNLRKVALWCMEGPPRIMQGWSEKLGSSLTTLELGRCAGVPATILVSVLSYLPSLRSLRLKGASSSAILEILSLLPNLTSLDTEYLGSGLLWCSDEPLASLQELTVRTSSIDVQGPEHLWPWIRRLLPRPSLETFTLNSFSTLGDAFIPRRFLLDLAAVHRSTLKSFTVSSVQLTINDAQCICTLFPALEILTLSIPLPPQPRQIEAAVAHAQQLRQLRLYTSWMPSRGMVGTGTSFGIEHARSLILPGKTLRVVGIGRVLYTGRWVIDATNRLDFEVVCDVVRDSWA